MSVQPPRPSASAAQPIERLLRPFQEFLQAEASGGILLLAATAVALIWANSPWGHSYAAFWGTKLTVGYGSLALSKPLVTWVNDGLMAVFFFVVGLEIKRELLVGELASPRKAALPIAAALGGITAPALIYFALNAGGPGSPGWAIPVATDIAFALGVLALLGDRIPNSLKVFLTALAIVDDIGAVLIIAIFYTGEISLTALGAGAATLLLLVLANLAGVRRPLVYALLGFALWVALLKSGVHATVAGVLLAMTIPSRIRLEPGAFAEEVRETLADFESAGGAGDDIRNNETRQAAVHAIEVACEHVQPPLLRLEHGLLPWSAFFIMPVFALANAGVSLGGDLAAALSDRVALGIILGLILGKTVGITGFTWLATQLGAGALPAGVRWPQIYGLSWLGGIGFTMSLFVASLAFADGPLLDVAKMGILAGSLIAGVIGWALLRWQATPS